MHHMQRKDELTRVRQRSHHGYHTPAYSTISNLVRVLLLLAGLRIRIHFIRIRIQLQHLRLNTDPDPDPIQIRIQGFNDQKLKKKFQLKKKIKFFWDQKLQFTYL